MLNIAARTATADYADCAATVDRFRNEHVGRSRFVTGSSVSLDFYNRAGWACKVLRIIPLITSPASERSQEENQQPLQQTWGSSEADDVVKLPREKRQLEEIRHTLLVGFTVLR